MYELVVQKNMTPDQRMMFQTQMSAVRKNPSTGLILAFFGLHYLYLDEPGKTILLWVLCWLFVGIIWWFVDLFRVKQMVEQYNNRKAQEIATLLITQMPMVRT